MHLIDVFILGAFIAYAIYSGLSSREVASRSLEEYFLAGRSLQGWRAGVSMAATQFAADTPLLVTGLIATAGIFSLWRLWIYALAFLMMGFLLAASWRRARVVTDAELTELRYGKKPAAVLRGVKAFYLGTLFNCTVLAMVMLAATRIAEPFLLWNQWLPPAIFEPVVHLVRWVNVPLTVHLESAQVWILTANNLISILAIVLVTAFYSTTGGLRSVVNTDVVQFFIMLLGTAVYAGFIVAHLPGGLFQIPELLREAFTSGNPMDITPDQLLAFEPSRAKDVSLALLAVFAFQWIAQINADGTGYLAQRSMACRSDKDAKMAAVVFTIAQVLLRSLMWLPIGLGLLLLFPPDPALPEALIKADREYTFVRGIAEVLPPGAMGLMLTGMLAALASTVDTHLNWGSSYWTNDLYKRFLCQTFLKREPDGRELVWVARSANILILFVALFIMTRLSSIQEAWQTSLLLGAGLGVILVLRWLWWRINAWSEITCLVVSLFMAIFLINSMPGSDLETDAWRMIIMVVVTTAAGIAAAYIAGPENQHTLNAFYLRARPAGFWKPVAEGLNEDPGSDERRFWRAVQAMVVCAFSVFCILAGVGSWISGSPAPVYFPWQGPWIAGLILLGAILVPVWWHLGFVHVAPEDDEPAYDAEEVPQKISIK